MKNYKALCYKNLKNDKRNTGFVFITVVLIIAVLVSTLIVTRYNTKIALDEIKKIEGNYDLRLIDINKEQLKVLNESDNIESLYMCKSLGVNLFIKQSNNQYDMNRGKGFASITTSSDSMNSINELYAVDLDVFNEIFDFELKSGRMPENENEILVTTGMLKEYGDNSIDLSVGNQVDLEFEVNRTYDMYLTYAIRNQSMDIEEVQKKINAKYGDIKRENKTLNVVGIIDVGEDNVLWHNKLFTVLTPEIKNSLGGLEVLTTLEYGVLDKDIANELNIPFKRNIKNYDSPIPPPYGYGESKLRYPNYWANDYDGSLYSNSSSIEMIMVVILSFVIIFNSFIASIAFRTKSLGILTAIGATKKQIRTLIIRETAILTILAIPFGLALGILQTKVISKIASEAFNINSMNMEVELSLNNVFVIIVLVLCISIIAILYALKHFNRYSPMEAMSNSSGIKNTVYTTKYGEVIDENKVMMEYLEYDEKTIKYKFMKKIFKIQGVIAYKNLSRNRVMNRNCLISILSTMILGMIFMFQYVQSNLNTTYSMPSNEWNVQAMKGIGNYSDSEIDEIKKIDQVNNVYRDMVNREKIIVENGKIDSNVLDRLSSYMMNSNIGKEYSILQARVRGVNDVSIDKYSEYLIDGSLDGGLRDNEIILVSEWVSKLELNVSDSPTYSILPINKVVDYKVGDYIAVPTNEDLLNGSKIIWNEDYNESTAIMPVDTYYSNGGETKNYKIKAIVSRDALKENERFSDPESTNEDLVLIISENEFINKFGDSTKNKLIIDVEKDERESVVKEIKNQLYVSGDSVIDVVEVKETYEEKNNIKAANNITYGIAIISIVLISLISTMIFNIFIRTKELAGLDAIGMSKKQKRNMILCESFSMALQAITIVVPISIGLFVLSLGNEISSGSTSKSTIIAAISIFIISIAIITTIIGLIPIKMMADKSIADRIRE